MKLSLQRWLKRLMVLAILVLVIWVLRLTVFKPDPIEVTVYVVDRGEVQETVVNSRSGTVHSYHEAEISPGKSGSVIRVPVKKGDRVEQGQTLLELDNSVELAQVDLSRRAKAVAEEAEREACLTADQKRRDLDRARQLSTRNLVSQTVLEQAETAHQVAESLCQAAKQKVSQAQAALRVAEATLDKGTVRAPFPGVIARVDAEVGEWISPAAPGLMIPSVISLVDLENLYVTAPLDEVDLNQVSVGLPVRITMDALPGRVFQGTLSWKSPRVETKELQNRTLEVEATFNEGTDLSRIVPGASADIEVILESRDDVLRVPSYAILSNGSVLVLRNGALEEVPVETSLKNWEFAEIVSGLAEGDEVVVSLDREEVKPGAKAVAKGETAS